MICPVCYNKIKHGGNICAVCKFRKDELNTASNKAVKKLLKERRYDDIIETKQFPSDLSYQKTFMRAVFGGWFGLHNFYVNKWFKGLFNIISLALVMILPSLAFLGFIGQNYMSVVIYGSVFYVITLIMWINDIISLLFKNYKVPVVLAKDIERKEKQDEAK